MDTFFFILDSFISFILFKLKKLDKDLKNFTVSFAMLKNIDENNGDKLVFKGCWIVLSYMILETDQKKTYICEKQILDGGDGFAPSST